MKTLLALILVIGNVVNASASGAQETIHLFAGISGTNEVPPNDSSGLEEGDFILSGSNLSFSIGPNANGGGIYGPAASGQAGPFIFDLGTPLCASGGAPCDLLSTCYLQGNVTLTSRQINGLISGLWYVDLGGKRGQITVTNRPVLVSAPPGGSYTGQVGETGDIVFSVSAWGTQPLNYFWVKNGDLLPGGACFLPDQLSDAGSFQFIVSNAFGSVTSAVYAVSMNATPPRPVPISVIARASPTNGGVVAGDGAYNSGSSVALLATPSSNYKFVNWTLDINVVTKNPYNRFLTTTTLVQKVVSASPVYTSVVKSSEMFTAHFALVTEKITTASAPPRGGSTGGGGSFTYGSTATVKAGPAPGYMFSSWTSNGTAVSPSASYKFTVLTNETLTANFVTNPFYVVDGVYNGLFYDAAVGVTPTNAGALSLTVTAQGAYSGTVRLGAGSYGITGQFVLAAGNGTASADSKITLPGAEKLDLALVLNTDINLSDAGAGTLAGTVTASLPSQAGSLWAATLSAHRSHYAANHPAPGLYNLAILPNAGLSGPLGSSYGSATVGPTGVVTLGLHMADGLSPAISLSSPLAQDGSFPMFASLYSGKGILLGWLNFTNDTAKFSGSQIDLESTTLFWTKLPGGALYYTNGFDAVSAPFYLVGCAYAPSTARTNRLGWTNGFFAINAPGIPLSMPGLYFNSVKNIFIAKSPNEFGLVINFNPANGLFTGSFAPAPPAPRFSFNGVLLNGIGQGAGFWIAPSHQTEAIWIGPAFPAVQPPCESCGDNQTGQ